MAKRTTIVSVTEEPQVEQLIKNTESVVHQTFEDLSGKGGIGESVDDIEANTDSILEEVRKLRREQMKFKAEIKAQITEEVAKQIKPLSDQLNRLMKDKPKFLFIKPHWRFWETK